MFDIGKSGYLPDVSKNFGYFKNLAVNCFQRKDYNGAISALKSLNGCLGEDYLVTINTKLYNELIDAKAVYQCNHCTMQQEKVVNKNEENEYIKEITVPTEIVINKVKTFDLIIPLVQSILSGGSTTKEAWYCPSCQGLNDLSETHKIVPEREQPFYLKVVPECPVKLIGLTDRMNYEPKITQYFWGFMEEINWQEYLYRVEWKSQNDGADMEAYKDKGDGS